MADSELDAGDESGLELPASMFRRGRNPQDFVLSAWKPSRNAFQTRTAKFAEIDGEAVFEGDIVLGPAHEVRRGLAGDRAVAAVRPEFRWPGGIIPYVAETTLRARVEAAIAHWQQKTPFRF